MPRNAVPTLTDAAGPEAVVLRGHGDADIEGCLEQCLDPLSQLWTTVPVPYSRDDARRFVREAMPGGWGADEEWGFAVEHRGTYAGTVSLRNERDGRAEIAYGSHPWVRGTGVMERALRLLLEWGFDAKELHTVVWWANQGNWASRKVAWRLGFTFEGTVRSWLPQRGELRDAWVGTLLRSDKREPRTIWYDVPRIAGEQVVLRIHRDDDALRVLEACTDERTAYWLGELPRPYTMQLARTFLSGRGEGMAQGTAVHWIVADPQTDLLLGTVSLFDLETRHQAEVGYWTHPDARGRGVMTEAVRLAVRHAFTPVEGGGLALRRVTLISATDNAASRHVAEETGFIWAGTLRAMIKVRDGLRDGAVYDLLAEEVLDRPMAGTGLDHSARDSAASRPGG
ncbi:MAG: GNAT family N-acetyltransferase [Actinomycetota bacterium]|nr:GNAT family N-acetyltransferase [Actinomycetota bacterium]